MSFEEDYSFDNYKNLSGSVVDNEEDGEIKKPYKIVKNRKSREEVMNEINKTKIKRNIIIYPIGLIMVSVAAYLTFDGIKTNNELNNLKNVNESTVSISPFEKNIDIDKTIDKSINVLNVDNKEGGINKDGIGVNSSFMENKKEKMSIEDKIESKVSIEVINVNKDNKDIKEGDDNLLKNLKSKESKKQQEYTIDNINVEEEIEVEKDNSKSLIEYKNKSKNKELVLIRVNALNHISENKEEVVLKYFFNSECYNSEGMIYEEKGSLKGEDTKVLGFSNNDRFYYYKNSNNDICKTEKGNIKNESIKVNNETIENNKEVSFNLVDTKNNIKDLGRNYQISIGVKYKCFITGENEIRSNTSTVLGIKDGEEIIFIKGEDVCITNGVNKSYSGI